VRGAEGVGEGHVFSVREQLLHGLWVTFDELVARPLESFEYSVEIIYSGHLELTLIVGTSSLGKGHYSLRASYAIHLTAWKKLSEKGLECHLG
jgi:hypothetical protein